MTTLTSRVFMNGNSLAIRIPQAFRLAASQVEITRNAHGDLVIHPLPPEQDRGAALLQALAAFDEDFAAQLEEDRRTPSPVQEREEL
jgi:antitoxin VapB